MVISGHQRSSAVISGHQRSSEVSSPALPQSSGRPSKLSASACVRVQASSDPSGRKTALRTRLESRTLLKRFWVPERSRRTNSVAVRGNQRTNRGQSYGNHMVISCNHIAIILQSYCNHMAIIWQSYAISGNQWQSPDPKRGAAPCTRACRRPWAAACAARAPRAARTRGRARAPARQRSHSVCT